MGWLQMIAETVTTGRDVLIVIGSCLHNGGL